MIVASLLLILVAVTMLVLGLTNGASGLLISSIVASLLAAVALVVGARQAAAARRGAAGRVPSDPAEPEFTAEPVTPAAAEYPRPATGDFPPAAQPFGADSASSARDTVQFDPVVESPADEAFQSGRRDAAAGMTAGASGARRDDDADDLAGEPEPDYERAAEAINAARSANPEEHAWRRAAGVGHAEAAELADQAGGAGVGLADSSGRADPESDDFGADRSRPDRSGPAAAGSAAAGSAASASAASGMAADSAAADEFADPEDDDPDDEPLPQAVRPADAVRVARMDAEVLVVDGRPRYHLPDCAHLIGRLTEPIPVDEAVELGFSPCGLCRPVDRLVTAAVRR